uniref:hypothetical protein n=1 Tax=Olsenella uli TaxID=133926 RepID=UPI0028EB8235|nr:hypothetical protein [Olsenella uli]
MARKSDGRAHERAVEYVWVYRFMTEGMGLRGCEPLVYARVFDFCRHEGVEFYESKRGTARMLGMSEQQVHRAVASLEARGIIVEIGEHVLPNNRITKRYRLVDSAVERAVRVTERRNGTPGS